MTLLSGYSRILWCLRYGIGDVVMELPVLESLRSHLPDAHLTVLGAHPAIELLDGDDRVDHCVALQELGLVHRWDSGSEATLGRLSAWLAGSGVELVLDSRHAPPALSHAIHTRGLPSLNSDPAAECAAVAAGKDAVAAIQESVRAGWGIQVAAARSVPRYRVAAADALFAERLLNVRGAERTVGLAPVASLALKRWPISRFSEVAAWIARELDAHVLLFSGPESRLAPEILSGLRSPTSCTVVGPVHLGKVSAFLARCEVLVSNDTGIAHLAAAVGTPTVGIFGPTDPRIYRPAGPRATSIGGEGIECAFRTVESLEPPGCWSHDRCLIGNDGCIHRVEVAAVQEAILRAIDDTATRPRSRALSAGRVQTGQAELGTPG